MGYKIGKALTKDLMMEIGAGNVTGFSSISKFGGAPDIDSGDGTVDVWDGCDDGLGTAKVTSYTYSSSADIDTVTSSDDSDTEVIEVQGLDTDFNMVTQDVTLTGRTKATLGTSLIRVFRMINRGSVSLAGDMYCFVDGAITLGVPDTDADVRAIIKAGNNQTLMALYTVPAGKVGYLMSWYASIAGLTVTNSQVDLFVRPEGENFQIKHRKSLMAAGSSQGGHEFPVPLMLAAKTDVVMRASSSSANGAITAGFDIILVDDTA